MNTTHPTLALLTDLDGTLLHPDKSLTSGNAKAIADFRAKGGLFSIATGRGLQATLPYLDQLQPDFPVILYNGAMVYDWQHQSIIASCTLPSETTLLIEEMLSFSPQIAVELLNRDGVYIVKDNEYEQQHMKITRITPQYRNLEEMDITQCYKTLFAGDPRDIDRLWEFVQQPQFAALSFTRSHSWFLEMLPPSVSKGAAVETIRKVLPTGTRLGTSGDYNNDLTMLAAADWAACPADAQPIVKEQIRQIGGYASPYTCAQDFFADWTAQFVSRYTK